jgi:hypothetical protein
VVRTFGLAGVGPAVFAVSLGELFSAMILVRRRNPHCAGLVQEVLRPLIYCSVGLALASAVGRFVSAHAGVQMMVTLLVFGGLIILREVFSGGRSAVREVRALIAMMRPGGNVVAEV